MAEATRVLVIGASSAIAQAVARIYAQRGARLVLVARDPSKLEALRATSMSTKAGNTANMMRSRVPTEKVPAPTFVVAVLAQSAAASCAAVLVSGGGGVAGGSRSEIRHRMTQRSVVAAPMRLSLARSLASSFSAFSTRLRAIL